MNSQSKVAFFLLLIMVKGVNSEEQSDDLLLQELMAIVDESTDIVTKTKMNANSVPGTVTVLQGSEMESLGAKNVWEALAFVPGILPATLGAGGPSLLARGVSFPFSSGNVKILVNSLSMSRESSGMNSSVLNIPIEQVKRIEVVRGPGAIVYGDNAFMGLVNIITDDSNNKAFVRAESNGALAGGLAGSYSDPDQKLKIHGHGYYYDNDSEKVRNGLFASEDRQFGLFSLAYEDFTLSLQSYHSDKQVSDNTSPKEDSDIFSIKQQIELMPELNLSLNFNYLLNNFFQGSAFYQGDTREGTIDLFWTGMQDHQWWFRFNYTEELIDKAGFTNQTLRNTSRPFPPPGNSPQNRPPGPLPPPERGSQNVAASPFKIRDISRKFYSFVLQNQFEITNELTLTSGIRFNYREDLNHGFFTPRIAGVWRISDKHILKAQYAEGFRAPTFFELYPAGNRINLKPEIIETSELSYIYHQPDFSGKITLFYSEIEDMLFAEGDSFGNQTEGENLGVELELSQQLLDSFKWQANFTFVDSSSTRNRQLEDREDFTSANWLANIMLFYQPVKYMLWTAHWNYTGNRDRVFIPVDDEHQLNLTLNIRNLPVKGLEFKVGLENLLADDEVDILTLPNERASLRYGNERTLWFNISYRL